MDDFISGIICPVLSLNVLNVLVLKVLHLMYFYLFRIKKDLKVV